MKIKLSCSLNDWAIYYDWAVYSTMDSTTYSTADFLLGYSTEGYFELNCGWGIVKVVGVIIIGRNVCEVQAISGSYFTNLI